MGGDKTWLRNNAATLTLLNKSHRADPRQAECYYVVCLWRRMAKKSAKMREVMERVWNARHGGDEEEQAQAKEMVKDGPMATLERIMDKVGRRWTGPTTMERRNGGEELDLRGGEDEHFQHEAREDIRDWVWRSDPAVQSRECYEGVSQGVDAEMIMKMYRAKSKGRKTRKKEEAKDKKKEGV